MSGFDDIRRAVWDGSIPCRIDLDTAECKELGTLEPYYVVIPRISYLPLFINQIYHFFESEFADAEVSKPENAWFEFEGVPLKWHWPVGVLYDLLTAKDPSSRPNAARDDDESSLPWNITLHFRNFPTKHLMSLDAPSACYDAWVNVAKEADFVRNGTAKAFMSLSKQQSTTLWDSIASRDYDKFWRINDKLIMPTANGGNMRSIPMRLYVGSAPRVIQEPIPLYQPSNDEAKKIPQTMGQVLHTLLPELFPTARAAVLARPVAHGVIVTMDTPVIEFMHSAVYPDGFLHITLAMMR